MGNPLNRDEQNCRRFLDALEELPLAAVCRKAPRSGGRVARSGRRTCGAARLAGRRWRSFAETRNAMAVACGTEAWTVVCDSRDGCNGAEAQEEEARDGVWISVRRLAPRLVALTRCCWVLAEAGRCSCVRRKNERGAQRRHGVRFFGDADLV